MPVFRLLAALVVIALALPAGRAGAQEIGQALVVGNERYARMVAARGAADAVRAGQALSAEGFRRFGGADLSAGRIRAEISDLVATREEGAAGRIVILLAGHFAQGRGESWFLGTDADRPDLATVGAQGVALSGVLAVAADAPGGAVVLLAPSRRRFSAGPGLDPGLGALEAPQGVTILRGPVARITDFAQEALPERGVALGTLVEDWPDLRAEGFVSTLVAFLPEDISAPDDAALRRATDIAAWESALEADTPAAYRRYLERFPRGLYAQEARAELERLTNTPERVEEALGLTRAQRVRIQRELSDLGYDTRGIDGIFGPGTRSAIRAWQRDNGLAETAFLTAGQIARLAEQAERRQAERERADRDYWNRTGAQGDEQGLRAYLERYPDGLYAETAQARLERIERARAEERAARDDAAWRRARETDTPAAYRDYLDEYPEGRHAEEARTRLDELAGPGRDAIEAARAAESRLGLNPVTRSMIERRLDALELNPGPVDGAFDARTREAIRRYQQSRGLPPTGYLDQRLMVELLADSVRGFFR